MFELFCDIPHTFSYAGWGISQGDKEKKANRRMRRYKRVQWNRADWNHACRVLDKLLPDPNSEK